MLPDAPPYMKWDEEVARQLTDFNKRLQHLERLEDPAGGYTEGARVYNDADILIGNAAVTTLTFNSERWDTDGIHSVLLNTDRLTCQTAGTYSIMGNVRWDIDVVGIRQVDIFLNGIARIAWLLQLASGRDAMQLSTIYDLSVADFVVLRVYQNSGGNLNVDSFAQASPEFMMQRIG